ncbi:hypothetical protein DXG01_009812 [Tephrocybe rancida]|nr:hypothetical protein DXG01_009812 [Tephrocybe rancida]
MDTDSHAYGAHPAGRHHLDSFNDTARNFCSIYLSEADQHDDTMTETWRVNMDSTLIFAGLFSATVTAFIIEGYKLLKQDPQDVTESLLKQILTVQLALASSNQTSPSVLPPITIPIFSPNASAIAVNSLWFLSLIASLAAALCVTLAQQWIRAYLHGAHRNTRPVEHARMRAFLFAGLEKWRFDTIIEFIPFLLHLSLFLFFVGLCVFMWAINRTVAAIAIIVVFCFFTVYGLATISPIYDLSSPYETPLSSPIWYIWQWLLTNHFRRTPRNTPFSDIIIAADAREEQAEHESSIWDDAKVLLWVYERTSDDDELEPFLSYVASLLETSAGRATWQRAFVFCDEYRRRPTRSRELILDIEERISHFLVPALKLVFEQVADKEGGIIRPTRSLTICLNALIGILMSTPAHRLPPYTEQCLFLIGQSLEQHLYPTPRIVGGNRTSRILDNDLVVSMNIIISLCTYRFPARAKEPPSHTDVCSAEESATEADRALWDLDHMRQDLEDAIITQPSSMSGDNGRIRAALESYLSVLVNTSLNLKKVTGTLVSGYRLGVPVDIGYMYWATMPERRYPITARQKEDTLQLPSAPFDTNRWSRPYVEYDIYALQVMALMRLNGLYPQLPEFSEPIYYTPTTDLLDIWFPQCRNSSTTTSSYLLRELQPVAIAMDILAPDLIGNRNSNLGKSILPPRPYENPLTPLKFSAFVRRPFSLLVSALQDADVWESRGAPTTVLIKLINCLENFLTLNVRAPPEQKTTDRIRDLTSKTLAVLYPPSSRPEIQTYKPMDDATVLSPPLKCGTTLVYIVALKRLFTFERNFLTRDSSVRFLFQEQDLLRLVDILQDALSSGSLQDIKDAERTFDIKYEAHAHLVPLIELEETGMEIHSQLSNTAPHPLASFTPLSIANTGPHDDLPMNQSEFGPQHQDVQRLSIMARSENVKKRILAQRAAFLDRVKIVEPTN